MSRQLIIFSFIFLSSMSAQDLPDWYVNPPKEEGQLFGVGSGDLRMKAILMALVEVGQGRLDSLNAQIYESTSFAETDTVSEIIKEISFFSLGDFTFNVSIEQETMEKEGKRTTENFEFNIKLMFSSKDVKSSINYYFKEEDEAVLSDHLEIFFLGMDETKLIEELEENGLDLKFARGPNGDYFALASIASDLVK